MLSEHSSLTSPPGPYHLPSSCLLSPAGEGDPPDPGSHSLKTQGHSGNSGASPSATTRGCSAHGVEPGLEAGAGHWEQLRGLNSRRDLGLQHSTTHAGPPRWMVSHVPSRPWPQSPADFLGRVSQTVMLPQSQSPHGPSFSPSLLSDLMYSKQQVKDPS